MAKERAVLWPVTESAQNQSREASQTKVVGSALKNMEITREETSEAGDRKQKGLGYSVILSFSKTKTQILHVSYFAS